MGLKNFGMITESEFVGKTLEDATKKANDDGFITRVVEENGNSYMLTQDFKTDRINFRTRNGIVTAAYGG